MGTLRLGGIVAGPKQKNLAAIGPEVEEDWRGVNAVYADSTCPGWWAIRVMLALIMTKFTSTVAETDLMRCPASSERPD